MNLEEIYICDNNPDTLRISEEKMKNIYPDRKKFFVNCEEDLWPFRTDTFDLVASNLNLHLCEDPEMSLSKILDSLVADGAYCGHSYGNKTLEELRACFFLVENERSGGIGSHLYK